MTRSRVFFLFIISLLLFVGTATTYAACPEPAIADYSALPVFLGNAVKPSILVILDNSSSMNEKAYTAAYDHNTTYYGYFEPHKKYTYSSNVFYRDESGDWDGNLLNWVSMRRVDVVRKVLMGGLATPRTGGGNQTNIGENPTGYSYTQYYDQTDTWGVTPNPNSYFHFSVSNGNFNYWYHDGAWHDEGLFVIKVKKGVDINGDTLADEGANFADGNLAGIMQRLWQKARFGLEIFNEGNDDLSNQNGGLIPRVIGSSMTDMIDNIQDLAADTWTPLAESYYTAVKYFMQEDMEIAMDQANNVIPNDTAAQDPYNNPDPVHCAKSFVLLLTDGASSKDLYIPNHLKDYDGDGNDGLTLVDSGTTPEGVLVATAGSDTVKTFYLNYIDGYAAGTTPYPSGTTPFTTNHIGDALVLYDSNDKQVYYGEITAVNTTYDDWDGTSGTSEITVSGTTVTPEWKSGVSPYTYDLSWKVVVSTPNNEAGGSNGSDYLDDLALYARTNDLRSDLSGEQNIILYPVYAFGSDATARNLLRDAAKNGGFEDRNGNDRPDLTIEWDPDEDGEPDNYYEASDGFVLETKLIQAVNAILERAASGTAVSVLATSGEGEGNLVQAFFRTSVPSGVTEVRWLGYLQSIWADSYGNLREDSDGDLALDETKDKVITHFLDSSDGNAKIKLFDVSEATPYPDVETDPFEVVEIDEIEPLWEAGGRLAQRSADDRKIFTFIDKDKDGVVDEPSGDDDPFDNDGEVILFHTSGVSDIKPYLGVKDDSTWDYLGASHSDRANNLVEYIRGKETGFSGTTTMIIRPRTVSIGGAEKVWKLGDIIHSTPVSISRPPDNYHIIYSDETYFTYLKEFRNRETVVYVGANDGMLHAVTSWVFSGTSKYFDSGTSEWITSGTSKQYTKPQNAPAGENIGDEIWAYIPQPLLPHLKWLPSIDYSHVYYMDLKPKVFDAKILPDDTHYTDSDTDDNWGTILLTGMNMGGKQICVEDDFDDGSGVTVTETRTFYPSYVCMDVTYPRNPRLLWERTYQELGMTTSIPSVVKVKDKWFAVFGSGPTDYEGTSDQNAHVFVVDLKTGDAYQNLAEFASGTTGWLFEAGESAAFMNSSVSLDKELNFNVDAIYFGETYFHDSSWKGKVYKVSIPWDWSDTSSYVDDPNDSVAPWTFSSLFEVDRPITATQSLSEDIFGNTWVYFGTGRYISQDDKTNDDTQYLFGFVDPFFDSSYDTAPNDYFHNYTTSLELDIDDLFEADPYIITTSGGVFIESTSFGTWNDLLAAARAEDGWYRTLNTSKERTLVKPTLLGGIVFIPTFMPDEDLCGYGGTSNLYGLYFETGTAFFKPALPEGTETAFISTLEYEIVMDKMTLGAGKSSALGIHVGQEEGAKAFIQQSTGAVLDADINPAFKIKSSLTKWRER